MSQLPTIILQMQRMGDLIMTFPLLGWLHAHEPQRPVWIVAERQFSEAVLDVCPEATFFPHDTLEALATERFHHVINLSHRPEAAIFAGNAKAAQVTGAVRTSSATFINGYWQLYRASIVHNNRHNGFHWADLNGLDTVPPPLLRNTLWPTARTGCNSGRIGLFVGASEEAKRPHADFWARLANALAHRGLRPVFLGGPNDRAIGTAAAEAAGLAGSNLCGNFSVSELAAFMQTLDLLITPDTGPMHLASWIGTPTLNLSMGPVNAWETAPAAPGHLVLRSTVSCRGCWQCCRHTATCREAFDPRRIGVLVHTLARHGLAGVRKLQLPGLELLETGRDASGLFELQSISAPSASLRARLLAFWREWFIFDAAETARQAPASDRVTHHGSNPESGPERNRSAGPDVNHDANHAPNADVSPVTAAWRNVIETNPEIAPAFRTSLATMGSAFASGLRTGTPLSASFWQQHPPLLRPLTGFLHLLLQNAEYRPLAWKTALDTLERLASLTNDQQG